MPNIVYTVAERLEMYRLHEQGQSFRHIVESFAGTYPDRPIPSKATVQKIVKKFRETGNLDPSLNKVSYPTRQLTQETKLNVCLKVEEIPKKPSSKIAQELGVSKTSVLKILRSERYKPYKFQEHQELLRDDNECRMVFSNDMMDHLNADPGLIDRICFSDESTVTLTGAPNRQNTRVWSQENPNVLIASGTQYQQKVNVWVGMIGNRLVGPFFIDGNLTGAKYLQMLRQQIVPALRAIEGDGPAIWFQQDGAPPHYTVAVRVYLNEEFPGRWIGRLGPAQWPARSPDLSPLDYSLWSYLKNKVYCNGPVENLQMLQNRISDILESMDPVVISNMNHAFYDRLGYCAAAEGGHFEHILRQRVN